MRVALRTSVGRPEDVLGAILQSGMKHVNENAEIFKSAKKIIVTILVHVFVRTASI